MIAKDSYWRDYYALKRNFGEDFPSPARDTSNAIFNENSFETPHWETTPWPVTCEASFTFHSTTFKGL
jgi:hypothetical protein